MSSDFAEGRGRLAIFIAIRGVQGYLINLRDICYRKVFRGPFTIMGNVQFEGFFYASSCIDVTVPDPVKLQGRSLLLAGYL